MTNLHRSITLLLSAAIASTLSGCFFKALSGIVAEVDGSLIISAEANLIAATCVDDGEPGGFIECTYVIDDPGGSFEITSSATLISEFGFLGVVIDPLIVQIPVGATDISGTYDDGAGNTGPLDVQSGFKSIPVDVNRHLFAEHRQQFVIAELPEGVAFEDVEFDFALTFEMPSGSPTPVVVKPIFAVRFANEEPPFENFVYYSPFLPCTTDMAAVTPYSIPGGSGDPLPIAITEPPVGCDNEFYLYGGFGVFPCDFDGDDDVDRDDLRLQANVRNAPALPGDRLDANDDGFITLNDVRRCALQCTTPQCQSQSADLLATLEEEDGS